MITIRTLILAAVADVTNDAIQQVVAFLNKHLK